MPYRVTLDDDVMGRVHEIAEPWVDSPNAALRKALDMEEGSESTIYFEIERVEEDEPSSSEAATASETGGSGNENTPRPQKRRTIKRRRRSQSRGRTRAPKGSLLDERMYWRPILEVLADSPNGAAPAREVVGQVGVMLADKLKPLDKERLESGGLRWHTRVMFARFRMKEAGLLKHDSPRGVWEISDRGQDALKDEQILALVGD